MLLNKKWLLLLVTMEFHKDSLQMCSEAMNETTRKNFVNIKSCLVNSLKMSNKAMKENMIDSSKTLIDNMETVNHIFATNT
jgi:hypothetical protein